MKVSIGYAWGQLQKAIASGHTEKIAKWRAVIDGMQAGSIDVGSRTPTKAPAWVTLEVATGGFATGAYAAGGDLAPWETQLAADRGVVGRVLLDAPAQRADRLHPAAAHADARVRIQKRGLSREPLGLADVVAVHSRDVAPVR